MERREVGVITIPDKIVRFLEQHANAGCLGARDRDLVPRPFLVTGWRVGADGRTVTVLVPGVFTPHLVESLVDNGQVALTVEEYPGHETYQLKGRYLTHRPADVHDITLVDDFRERLVKHLRPMYPDDTYGNLLRAAALKPSLAVEFEVHEVYLQTPGPGAGSRLAPPPEA